MLIIIISKKIFVFDKINSRAREKKTERYEQKTKHEKKKKTSYIHKE